MKNIYYTLFCLLLSFSSISQTDSNILLINNYLSELSRDRYFSLGISISKNDTVLLNDTYGYANREHKILNKKNTRFNIASIGKLFTSVAILQLQEAEKLDIENFVGEYIPNFPNSYIRDSVTIQQLLTHTSGLPLWFYDNFENQTKFEYSELDDYLKLYEDLRPNLNNIEKYNYSNVGFITLGYLIEKLSGMTYKAYLNKYIFRPTHMNETNAWKLTELIPNVATGYIRPTNKNDWWKTNSHVNHSSNPAGGTYSSSRDLIKFYNGLLNNELLSKESVDLMFEPEVETIYGHYGKGVAISEYYENEIIGHLGGNYGVRGELLWYKDAGYIVAILANSDQTDYVDISYFIKVLLAGSPEKKEAYNNTRELLNSNFEGKSRDEIEEENYDFTLIQIKGYFHFNNQDYDLARDYFYLNTVLFPENKEARNDFEKLLGEE